MPLAPAPPTGQPISTAPPVAAPPLIASPLTAPPSAVPTPRRRRWIIPVVIGGSLAVLALVAGVAAVAVQLANLVTTSPVAGPPPGAGDPEDLVDGEPAPPVAVDPLECTGCFTIGDAQSLGLPGSSYAGIGLTDDDDGEYDLTAGEDQIDQSKWWADDGGTPAECYFIYPKTPLFFTLDDPSGAAADDPVHYPVWHFDPDEVYYFTEGLRVFDDSASAVEYLANVEEAVAGCPDYAFPPSGWAAVLTPAPALDLPDSVAAYGWVESGGSGRFYAVDLQRGNLVARLTLNSDAGGPSELEFRALVEEYAELLAALEPLG